MSQLKLLIDVFTVKSLQRYMAKEYPGETDTSHCTIGGEFIEQLIRGSAVSTGVTTDYQDLKKILTNDTIHIIDLDIDHESHCFTLVQHNNELTLLSTYGGYDGVIIRKYPRELWLYMFEKICLGDIFAYSYAFGVLLKRYDTPLNFIGMHYNTFHLNQLDISPDMKVS